MRAIVPGSAAILRSIIAALPKDRVRDLLAQLLLDGLASTATETPAPANRRRAPQGKPGAPRKVAKTKTNGAARTSALTRGERERERKREYNRVYAARRRAKLAGKPAPAIAAAGKPSGRAGRPQKTNGGDSDKAPAVAPPVAITPQLFWDRARELEPGRPWLVITREFDTKETVARGCYDRRSLPPGVGPMAVYKFLGLTPP